MAEERKTWTLMRTITRFDPDLGMEVGAGVESIEVTVCALCHALVDVAHAVEHGMWHGRLIRQM